MDNRKNIIKKLKKFKDRLKKEFKVNRIIFFGSRAEGNPHKDSDIDLIIISKYFENKSFRYRPLGFYNYWDLNYPVDFLCYTPKEFNKLKKQITLVRTALKEGIEI